MTSPKWLLPGSGPGNMVGSLSVSLDVVLQRFGKKAQEAVSKPGGRGSCRAKDAANLGSAGASPSRITVLKRLQVRNPSKKFGAQ